MVLFAIEILVTTDPVTAEKILQKQEEDQFCRKLAQLASDPQSCFDYDRYGIVVRNSKLNGATQKNVP